MPPIYDTDAHVLRARRTAAWTRGALGLMGIALIATEGGRPVAVIVGFAVLTAGLLLTSGRLTRELGRLLHQARYDADHDDLTGLLSYAAFRALLERSAAECLPTAPMSLLLLDLERFGVINKAHGHAAGDRLLAQVGENLRAVAGPGRAVGRLGGDEFAVILPSDDPLPLARALLDALPKRGEEDPRPISACVGISKTPRDGDSGEALLRAADIALRVAKRSGLAGQISTYEGGSLSGRGAHSARHTLDRLIEGEGLSMAVQPIVDLRSGSVHAYEALARFGRRSTDSPLHWLAIAEELGERDLLEHACLRAALELFPSRPPGIRLSVNLSAPVLMDPRTLAILERPADLSGLIIEVTEEALVQSEAQLHQVIDPLLARGAMLAVDDMGAGYSGLRQITTVHPNYLKLDRSLIAGIDEDEDRQALVGALVGYAKRVGSLLVAEGMESASELQALLDLGVPLVQGFYVGRPAAPWPQVALAELAATA
jgi:diguanylate cyclase (GGDEF)-like protein